MKMTIQREDAIDTSLFHLLISISLTDDTKVNQKRVHKKQIYDACVWLSNVLSACDTDHANVFDVKNKYSSKAYHLKRL